MQHDPAHAHAHAQAGAGYRPIGQTNGPAHKRVKTNGGMVTTKYAPPPGYVLPVTQASYGNWSGYGAQGYSGYYGQQHQQQQQQQYAQFPSSGHPGYPGVSGQHQRTYYQPPSMPPQYGQPALAEAAAAVATAPYSSYQPLVQQGFQPVEAPDLIDVIAHNINVSAASTEAHHTELTGPLPAGLYDEVDEDHADYCEFTRPCYYAFRESEIVPKLSLGLRSLKTAIPSLRAVPAVWGVANEVSAVQRQLTKYGRPDDCISVFHSITARADELNPVRNTARWNEVKDDLIYKVFPSSTPDLVTLGQLQGRRRSCSDQQSLNAISNSRRGSNNEPATLLGSTTAHQLGHGSAQGPGNFSSPPTHHVQEGSKKRTRSQTNLTPTEQNVIKKHCPNTASHAAAQDEVLARLGVTGQPKPRTNFSPPETDHKNSQLEWPYSEVKQNFESSAKESTVQQAQPPVQQEKVNNQQQQEEGALVNKKKTPPKESTVKESTVQQAPPPVQQNSVSNQQLQEKGASLSKKKTPPTLSTPINKPVNNPKESPWTKLAREYQMDKKREYQVDNKRSYEDSGLIAEEVKDSATEQLPNGKRRKEA